MLNLWPKRREFVILDCKEQTESWYWAVHVFE